MGGRRRRAAARAQNGAVDDLYMAHPSWPGLPANLVLGQVTSVAGAADGSVYVLHRGTPPVLVVGPHGANDAHRHAP